ncbi:MAG: methylmalonyl-CoA epimerase [Anaerolineae bacterium]|nr:methylmalonyl-CoA epimerase [Anaerolineae bacterium]
MSVKRIDHIAIVVSNLDEATTLYRDVLGLPVAHTEHIAEQEVIVACLPAGDSEIELLQPVNETSGVARYLAKNGPGIHHICLEVEDIEQSLTDLKAAGMQLINEQPTTGAGGKRVAFVHPKSAHGVLIELYEAAR